MAHTLLLKVFMANTANSLRLGLITALSMTILGCANDRFGMSSSQGTATWAVEPLDSSRDQSTTPTPTQTSPSHSKSSKKGSPLSNPHNVSQNSTIAQRRDLRTHPAKPNTTKSASPSPSVSSHTMPTASEKNEPSSSSLSTARLKKQVNVHQAANDLSVLVPSPDENTSIVVTEEPIDIAPSAPISNEPKPKNESPQVDSTTPAEPTSDEQTQNKPQIDPQSAREVSRALRKEIDRHYSQRKPYPADLIRKWIDSLKEIDTKIDKTVIVGSQEVNFKNESQSFVQAFEALVSPPRKANVPLKLENGETQNIDLFIGGTLINKIANTSFVGPGQTPCDTVICALSHFHEPIIMRDIGAANTNNSISSKEAAYDVLFIYFYYKYLVAAIIPEEFKRSIEPEAIPFVRPFDAEAVRILSKTFWMLPNTFFGMKTVLYLVNFDSQSYESSRASNSQKDNSSFLANRDVEAYYSPGFASRPGSRGLGVVTFKSNFANFAKRETVILNGIERSLTLPEIEIFRPDFSEIIEYDSMMSAVHELAHAYDDSYSNGVSETQAWLELSGWSKSTYQDVKIPVFDARPWNYSTNPINPTRFLEWTTNWILPRIPRKATDGFVTVQGAINPAEDFATSIEGYTLFPDYLQQVAKTKHDFLRSQVFTFTNNDGPAQWEYLRPLFSREKSFEFINYERRQKGLPAYDLFKQQFIN